MILGLDFLVDYKCDVDFQYNTLKIKAANIFVALTRDSKFGYARCLKPEVIPANSEVAINVRISSENKNETILLDPAENLQGVNIVGARCLVTTKKGKAVIKLANPSDEDVYLSPTGILANVHPIDFNQIYDLEEDEATSVNVSNINLGSDTSSKDNAEIPDYIDNMDFDNKNLTTEQKQKLKQF